MNPEIQVSKRPATSNQCSSDYPDTYFPSNETVNQNITLPADFVILCPSPELNIFDSGQANIDYPPSQSGIGELKDKLIGPHRANDLGSLRSFELWNYDNVATGPRSLPKEKIETQSDIDIRSSRSLKDQLHLNLKTTDLEDIVLQAEELNKQIHEKISSSIDNKETVKDECSLSEIVDKNTLGFCNCKKSRCLRLHCVCFSELKECGKYCKCTGCRNNSQFNDIRNFVIEKTREINPLAFKPKIKNFKGANINSRGCNCTKNKCLKRYCECFKSGSGCTTLCNCLSCKNMQDNFGNGDISEIKDKGYRRKHKIVINELALDKRVSLNQNNAVSFVKHKKKRKSKLNY